MEPTQEPLRETPQEQPVSTSETTEQHHNPQLDLPPPEQPAGLIPSRNKRPARKYLLAGMITGAIVAAAGITAYILHQKGILFPGTEITKSAAIVKKPASVTLYYSDSKTVLWETTDPEHATGTSQKEAFYFVQQVRRKLKQQFGKEYGVQGKWQVTTTLDKDLQDTAEKLVADNVANLSTATKGTADAQALILEDAPSGQVKALVGGADPTNAEYGLIDYTDTKIEPGSAVKAFDYLALLDLTARYGAGSKVDDTQGPIEGYPCTDARMPKQGGNCLWDYDMTYPGSISLRYALGGLRNVPAVKAAAEVGYGKVNDLIKKMGAESGYNCYEDAARAKATQCYGAAAIGDGAYVTLADLAHAYGTLANGGKKVPQVLYTDVSLDGEVKQAWKMPQGEQIVRSDAAYIINDIASDPNASYLPPTYKFQRFNGWRFGVMGGTTNNGFGGSNTSWSSQFVAAAWVGSHAQDKNIQQNGAQIETLTIPLTRGLMEAAHTGKAAADWTKPADMQTLPAFLMTKKVSRNGEVVPGPITDLFPSWYKQ